MNPAMATHVAGRMLLGFVAAVGALVLGVILIRRMRALVEGENAAEAGLDKSARTGASLEHAPILPRK